MKNMPAFALDAGSLTQRLDVAETAETVLVISMEFVNNFESAFLLQTWRALLLLDDSETTMAAL
jgi:hypothetical protein